MVKRLEVESVSQTRRQFCQQACHAASLAALGVILPGCGGSSDGTHRAAAESRSLPVLNSTITGNAFMLTIDANSPLNTVGNAALVQASGRPFLVAHTAQDTFVALTAHLHARGVHGHRASAAARTSARATVPLQHGRRRRERSCAEEPGAVCERLRQRRAHRQRVERDCPRTVTRAELHVLGPESTDSVADGKRYRRSHQDVPRPRQRREQADQQHRSKRDA